MSLSARKAAVDALEKLRRGAGMSEHVFDSVIAGNEISDADTALASRIYYGVIQNMLYIDAVLTHFSSVSIKKVQPKVMDILRCAVFQILFLDRVPDSAAVNEAVNQCKKSFPKAGGYVNAVLRKISKEKDDLPEFGNTPTEKLSIKYSHPVWFTEYVINLLGLDGAEKLLSADNTTPPVFLQKNTLSEKSLDLPAHEYLENCYTVQSFSEIANKAEFKSGAYYVQDPAAKMSVIASDVKPGDTVIDVCAAPGGKSITAAMLMQNIGTIKSFDINDKKITKISDNAARLGIDIISAEAHDGKDNITELNDTADVVLCDVPCSGFGVIRKKPEIRYKSFEEVKNLPQTQLAILENASRYVKRGGVILYSTCTILTEENEDVVNSFIEKNREFTAEDFTIPAGKSENGMMRLYPHIHNTDGFFICKLRRSGTQV